MLRATVGLLTLLLGLASASAQEQPRAFIELFTSQGCASCPAADALIGELAEREGLYAVSMPVRLWDFLGWADTLATDDLTKRQIAYSVARGDRDVFTPQVIVNGERSVLGNDMEAIRGAIRETEHHLTLPIALSVTNGVLSISVGEGTDNPPSEKATLWLLVVDEKVRVPVQDGENRGRKLTYHNVVRDMRPIGMWKGKPMTFDLPLNDIEKDARAGCFVIAQIETFKGPGPIIGAAKLEHLFPARAIDTRRTMATSQ
ncbi:DUF1223 domain-containing protein [Acuticoccus kandeliae]|uniref:DUF1223 domain-containing protein n=1 Tax=Acuticoccus kandeliae TaxID=2073160 RepID=UPI001300BB6D|nr:DUF1223 domain-containing protein [Acuticoccus kandeliae]